MIGENFDYRTSDEGSALKLHNSRKAYGQTIRVLCHTSLRLCHGIAGHIGIRYVRQGGHPVTPQPTRCASGPHLAARRAQGATGVRTKYGKQSNEGRIDRQRCRTTSNTLQQK